MTAKPPEQTTDGPGRPRGATGSATPAVVVVERERCRQIVVDVLTEEGWVGSSFERIMDGIKNG